MVQPLLNLLLLVFLLLLPPTDAAPVFVQSSENFPSYRDFAGIGSIEVAYDKRSILLNGTRALFLSGSIHGPRGTPETWATALDSAVANGLNMVQVYVFWNYHRPTADGATDWHGEVGEADLAGLIEAAAVRGLFVFLRVGPYVCGEWDYGGVPVWVGAQDAMVMRSYNEAWMAAMQNWTAEVVEVVEAAGLWAHQGGPVVLAQIENELDASDDPENGAKYVQWCGDMANALVPTVPWIMCNGDAASNTINSCNGYEGGVETGSCVAFIEAGGESGRILVDQPALWTENEGGFQIWGDDPADPSDYFWGLSAASLARETLQWFARGGCHTNYYMWWGGYNRGRFAGAGIANMYAVDAPVCPDGRPHQPKYDHLTAMHAALAAAAPALLGMDAQVHNAAPLERWDAALGAWVQASAKLLCAFVYVDAQEQSNGGGGVAFLENNADESVLARFPADSAVLPLVEFGLSPLAVTVADVETGAAAFNSAVIGGTARAYTRVDVDVTELSGLGGGKKNGGSWRTWRETIGAPLLTDDGTDDTTVVVAAAPLEQSALSNFDWLSEYAWYETNFTLPAAAAAAATTTTTSSTMLLEVDTQMSNGFVLFIDGVYAGAVDDHQHKDGNVTLSLDLSISSAARGREKDRHHQRGKGGGGHETEQHTLQLLSESLGFHNLIGRWGSGSTAKTKGITGRVSLAGASLVSDSSEWRMRPALHGESCGGGAIPWSDEEDPAAEVGVPALWSTTTFSGVPPPAAGEGKGAALFLDLSSLGRGHAWVNGHDLGRFWNIERADGSGRLTQKYYHIPEDFLVVGGRSDGAGAKYAEEDAKENTLVLFDALGGDFTKVRLVRSHTKASATPVLLDEIDSPASCLSS